MPACPADNSKLYQNQIPARCTRVQFESLNLEEENRQVQDIAVQVRDTKKQSIIPVVRPANGVKVRRVMFRLRKEHLNQYSVKACNLWHGLSPCLVYL